MRGERFEVLCTRVRAAIVRRMGANASKEMLMLLDLIELLGMDKVDKVREVVDSSGGN